ncbi:MAG TPA: type II toxin-antitoxin system VapC family toxin [Pyrinomonadaceae bacterium]|nr:type II toxin-antitoxin system VapC family toxin [Pyrinomonadaceae bacterium]
MKIDDGFQNVNFVGLDTSPFIYFVERNPVYVDIMRGIFKRLTDDNFQAFSSVITLTEVLVQPLRQNNQALADKYRDLLFNGINFKLIPLNSSIAETAARLRARHNLRTPDALQIATALENGCDAFLCNDRNLKRVTELKILILDEIEL